MSGEGLMHGAPQPLLREDQPQLPPGPVRGQGEAGVTPESLGPTQSEAREGQGEAVGTPGLLSAFTQSPRGRAAAR